MIDWQIGVVNEKICWNEKIKQRRSGGKEGKRSEGKMSGNENRGRRRSKTGSAIRYGRETGSIRDLPFWLLNTLIDLHVMTLTNHERFRNSKKKSSFLNSFIFSFLYQSATKVKSEKSNLSTWMKKVNNLHLKSQSKPSAIRSRRCGHQTHQPESASRLGRL